MVLADGHIINVTNLLRGSIEYKAFSRAGRFCAGWIIMKNIQEHIYAKGAVRLHKFKTFIPNYHIHTLK